MSITLEWYDDQKTIILQTFSDQWTINQFRAVVDKSVTMLKSVEHPVYFITDFSGNKTNLSRVLHIANYIEVHLQTNYTLGVIVGLNAYLKSVIKIARTIAPRLVETVRYADDIEAAVAIIKAYGREHLAPNGL